MMKQLQAKNSSAKMLQNKNKQEITKYLTMAAILRMMSDNVWVNDKHEQVQCVPCSH